MRTLACVKRQGLRGEDSFRKLSVKEVEAENRAVENQDEAPEESSGMKMKM